MAESEEMNRSEPYLSRLIRVGKTRNKGRGMFVQNNATIPEGTLLLREPVLLLGFEVEGRAVGSETYMQLIKSREEEYLNDLYQQIESLVPNKLDPKRKWYDRLSTIAGFAKPLGIFLKHAIRYGLNDPRFDHRIFGYDLSKFNHGCIPNTALNLERIGEEPEPLVIELRAVKDLEAGDEITMPYTTVLAERDHRRKVLKSIFRFECRCMTCQLENDVEEYSFRFLAVMIPFLNPNPLPGAEAELAKDAPWKVYRLAFDVWSALDELDLFGEERVAIMRSLSTIAAIHSDRARSKAFLAIAINLGVTALGNNSHIIRNVASQFYDPELIPRYGETSIGESSSEEVKDLVRIDNGIPIVHFPWLFMTIDNREQYLKIRTLVRERDENDEFMLLSNIDTDILSRELSTEFDSASRMAEMEPKAQDEAAKDQKRQLIKEKKRRHAANKRAKKDAAKKKDEGQEMIPHDDAGASKLDVANEAAKEAEISPTTNVAAAGASLVSTEPHNPPRQRVIPAVPDVRRVIKKPAAAIAPLRHEDVGVILSWKGARRESFSGYAYLELQGQE